ncbi:GNAT family N-acetyltransferase [Temperatibacter marinus]|uniref:GNAT family N-acetyltransferase n=1 Tax=Temperatibacter marinus TaxID=1456591 RepID=A0AA52EFY9_9PROT|nr:GNAT family N-acetyltransferase [Temperatibacter marinus]WND01361.1 GNAT family N-acetyltransferase [Temperatibacter marinus]
MRIEIIPYTSDYRNDFAQINLEWLTQFFRVEEVDETVLNDPEQHILDKGGEIYFAQLDQQSIVGAISLKHQGNGLYELSKMGVTPAAQGLGAGALMIKHVIKRFHELKGRTLYLESNDILRAAIYLYEKHGFHHKPFPFDSHFERANVYMEYENDSPTPVNISPVETAGEIALVKGFFRDYALWLESQTGLSLEFQGFSEEMATFPSKYRCLLLAYQNKKPVGAVALLDHDPTICEMKRLWVKPNVQKSGIGKALSICIMNRAKNYGYHTMRLDSLKRLAPAVRLYQSLGFKECDPYNENPEDDVTYMSKKL